MATICYPVSRPVRTTQPTLIQEPVSLPEAKKQCEIPQEVGYHDDQLQRLIVMSREQVEQDTRVVCYTGTYSWKLTEWPYYRQYQVQQHWSLQGYADWLELPDLWPITAVSSITYVDTSGTTQTWDATAYSLEASGVHQLIRLVFGQYWPIARGDINGITINFTAGYSSVTAIPQRIKFACLMQLKIQWLLAHEGDASREQEGYERLVTGLTRGTYA